MSISDKITNLGYQLPQASAPVGSYVPYLINNDHIFVSGQISKNTDTHYQGILGQDANEEDGFKAAEVCVLNILAQLGKALDNDFSRIEQFVKLSVFIQSAAGFTNHAQIANGASDLVLKIFDEKGKHTRAAVGCSSLPLNSLVEIDAIIRIK